MIWNIVHLLHIFWITHYDLSRSMNRGGFSRKRSCRKNDGFHWKTYRLQTTSYLVVTPYFNHYHHHHHHHHSASIRVPSSIVRILSLSLLRTISSPPFPSGKFGRIKVIRMVLELSVPLSSQNLSTYLWTEVTVSMQVKT